MINGIEDLKGNQSGYGYTINQNTVIKMVKDGKSTADIAEELNTTEVDVLNAVREYKEMMMLR